jgi:RNA polymerase sigma-70 factor (ECF subfamily)
MSGHATNAMEDNFEELVKKVQSGDMIAFGPLYDAHIEQVYRFVWYKVQHKELAEDLTSQVFMKALEKISSFNAEKASFKTWVLTIARNTVIDHWRTARDHRDIEDAWDLDSSSDTARDAEAREQLEKVQMHLKKLSTDQRDIIILRVWEGLSYKEIAEALGKSESACKMSCSRGLAQLRRIMPLSLYLVFINASL